MARDDSARLTEQLARWPELALVGAFAMIAPLLFLLPITHDAIWQMWIGRQLAHGARLYVDIIEVNPPLWFWIATPLARIAELIGVDGRIVLIGFFALAIALSFLLLAMLVRPWPAIERSVLYAAAGCAMLLLPLESFTQREHFAVIVTLPYVLLTGLRASRSTVAPGLAIAVGLAAAPGIALKPYFLMVPAILELWLWRDSRRVRPEALALGFGLLLYALAVRVFAAEYLTDTLPLLRQTYPDLSVMNPLKIIPPVIAFGLAGLIVTRPRDPRAAAFLVAALSFLLVYIVQHKGWSYQLLPALAFLVVAVALEFASSPSKARGIMAFAALMFIFTWSIKLYDRPTPTPVARALERAVPGDSAVILSIGAFDLFPEIERRQLRWPIRYFSLWVDRSIQRGNASPEVKRRFEKELTNDLFCLPPKVLLIDSDGPASVTAFVARSPGMQALLRHYRRAGTARTFAVYERVSLPPSPRTCRSVA